MILMKQERVQERIGFVFIHGAGLEGRVWEQVTDGLGFPALLADFPLRDKTYESRRRLKLQDYVRHIRDQVLEWNSDRIVLVAHSLGGVLALQLAAELSERMAGFVAVSAAIPKQGGSFLSALPLPQKILLPILLRTVGTKPPASAIRSGLCSDVSAEQAEDIVQRFVPESVSVYSDKIDASAPEVPKLYIRLKQDKEFGLPLQNKMITNLSPQHVYDLDAGHLPMLSQPDQLRAMLQRFMTEAVYPFSSQKW